MKQICLVLAIVFGVGCGASSSETEATIVADTLPETSTEPVFHDMAFGERQAFMKDVVIPEMKPIFVEEHPDFSCASCHGDNMAEINFEMPNTLDPLNPAAMPFESEDEKIKKTAMWMKETVVPKMAGLLQEEIYNPDTKQGFGCFECHATQTE